MSIYWGAAKKEAQRLANSQGFCWVWPNPKLNFNEPYVFRPMHEREQPDDAPGCAKCFARQYPHTQKELDQ